MKLLPILLLACAAFAVSCERHDFDNDHGTGTRQLNDPHGPKTLSEYEAQKEREQAAPEAQ